MTAAPPTSIADALAAGLAGLKAAQESFTTLQSLYAAQAASDTDAASAETAKAQAELSEAAGTQAKATGEAATGASFGQEAQTVGQEITALTPPPPPENAQG